MILMIKQNVYPYTSLLSPSDLKVEISQTLDENTINRPGDY